MNNLLQIVYPNQYNPKTKLAWFRHTLHYDRMLDLYQMQIWHSYSYKYFFLICLETPQFYDRHYLSIKRTLV